MAQHDYSIANQSGSSFRSDLNNALAAIVSQNSGASAPSTTFAYQTWADTTDNVMKIRNSANDGWIELYQLDGTLTIEAGTVSAPGLAFRGDLDTGIWQPAVNQFAISTNAIERVEWGTSEVVFNDGGNNYDFRVEGDTDENLLFIDASLDRVGIGATTVDAKLHVRAGDSDTIANILRLEQFNAAATDRASLVVQADAANNLITFDSTGTNAGGFAFDAGGNERARITSTGVVLVGTSTSIAVGNAIASDIQLASDTGFISQTRYSANAAGSTLFLAKSRNATVGSNTIVVNGDDLGQIIFVGDDGTDLQSQAAVIRAQVDGTPNADDMPGRLVFSTTADGAATPTERFRITNDGVQGYNQAAPVAVNTTATLTVANLKNGIITSTTAAAVTGTLPTGTLTEGGFNGLYTNFTFEWTVINTGATNNFTVAAGTDHTVVGNMVVAAGNSGRFATRRTAANTFVTYRLSS